MRWWIFLLLGGSCLALLSSGRASAFTYEVLFDETLAHDAATLGRSSLFSMTYKTVLLDGKIETRGTEAVTYDRVLVNSLRLLQQIPITPNASFRLVLPAVVNYQKQEGRDAPRIITEATWYEAKPSLDFIFATQNNLDILLGLDLHAIGGYTQKTEAPAFTAKDKYDPLSQNHPHIVVVKHAALFDGGFSFQFSSEKSRKVRKSSSLDDTEATFDDRVYEPMTISIFANMKPAFGEIYGEFAAVEASGGGNVTENNVSVREDYFRFQLSGLIPIVGKDILLDSSLLYKSLSYADNRNVTLDTIPMMALHLKLRFNYGFPLYAGLIGVKGSDGQSLQEFNANYRIVGFGGVLGMNLNF